MAESSSVNVGSLLSALNRIAADTPARAQAGLEAAGQLLVSKIVEVVPLEEGPLQNSVRAVVQGNVLRVGAGSGPSAAYAVRQHEDPSLRHDAGRTDQFVARPFQENQAAMLALVQRAVSVA